MSHYKQVSESWDISNGYDPTQFKDNKLRWWDSDNSIRYIRGIATRLLLCRSLEECTQKVDALFDNYNMQNPSCAKVLRAIAHTLSVSDEKNWRYNLRHLYKFILA